MADARLCNSNEPADPRRFMQRASAAAAAFLLILPIAPCRVHAAEAIAAEAGTPSADANAAAARHEEPAAPAANIPSDALEPAPYVTKDMLRGIIHDLYGSQIVITAKAEKEHDGFTSGQRKVLDKRFAEASMPFCLQPDGLKHQPTSIGPFGLVGLAALPMVAVAAFRGKCKP